MVFLFGQALKHGYVLLPRILHLPLEKETSKWNLIKDSRVSLFHSFHRPLTRNTFVCDSFNSVTSHFSPPLQLQINEQECHEKIEESIKMLKLWKINIYPWRWSLQVIIYIYMEFKCIDIVNLIIDLFLAENKMAPILFFNGSIEICAKEKKEKIYTFIDEYAISRENINRLRSKIVIRSYPTQFRL